MDLRSFPKPPASPSPRDTAVDIDHLLTLTNTRLFRITGDADVIATRLGLRHLKRLGMQALVVGTPTAEVPESWLHCANGER